MQFLGTHFRTLRDLSYHKRINIFKNWCHGRYEEHIFFHHKFFHPSHIHLEKDLLYITHGGQLRIHRRLKKGILNRRPELAISEVRQPDITCFAKKENTIFAGRRDGCVFIASTNNTNELIEEHVDATTSHNIEFLDFDRDIFLTTTRTSTKLWRKQYELDVGYLEPMADLNGGNKCLRISSDARLCATGKYNEKTRTALRLVDLET